MAVICVQAEEPTREAKRRFKGVELYSWRDEAGHAWRFSLLTGTNRNNLRPEVTAPQGMAEDVAALKLQLAHLAIGESVIWTQLDRAHHLLPPREVIDEIVRAATALQLQLDPPRP